MGKKQIASLTQTARVVILMMPTELSAQGKSHRERSARHREPFFPDAALRWVGEGKVCSSEKYNGLSLIGVLVISLKFNRSHIQPSFGKWCISKLFIFCEISVFLLHAESRFQVLSVIWYEDSSIHWRHYWPVGVLVVMKILSLCCTGS